MLMLHGISSFPYHYLQEEEGTEGESKAADTTEKQPTTSSAESAQLSSEKKEETSTTTGREEGTSVKEGDEGKDEPEEKEEKEKEREEVVSSTKNKDSSSSDVVCSSASPSAGLGRPIRSSYSEQLSRTPTSLARATNMSTITSPLVASQTGLTSSGEQDGQLCREQMLVGEEGSEMLIGSDVLLLNTQVVAEKKEVELDIPGAQEELETSISLKDGSVQLDKELNTSELDGELVYFLSLSLSLVLSLILSLFLSFLSRYLSLTSFSSLPSPLPSPVPLSSLSFPPSLLTSSFLSSPRPPRGGCPHPGGSCGCWVNQFRRVLN